MPFKPCPICGSRSQTENVSFGDVTGVLYSCPLNGDYVITYELNEFLLYRASLREKLLFQRRVAEAVEKCGPPEAPPFFDFAHGLQKTS